MLRKERNDESMVAMEWQPEGEKWDDIKPHGEGGKRTQAKEMVQLGAAQDKASWRETVTALYVSWREEK